jgi:hypothetical protein
MFHSPRHPFFMKYRFEPPTCPIGSSRERSNYDGNKPDSDQMEDRALMVPDPTPDIEEEIEYNRRETALALAEQEADPIMSAIWNRYRTTKSAQEVSRFFDVPHSYIRRQLKAFKERIQHHYNQQIPL